MKNLKNNAKKHWITTVSGLIPILLMLATTFLGLTAEEGSAIQVAITQILDSLGEGQSIVAICAIVFGSIGNVLLVFSRDPNKKTNE